MVRPWVFCLLLFTCSSTCSDSWMPLINLTQRLLREANSSFSSNCWVCLSIQTQRSLAMPAPLRTWTETPMKLRIMYSARTLSGPYPITDLERRLQNFQPLTPHYSFANPDRRAIAFLQIASVTGILPILSRITSVRYPNDRFYESAQRPIWGSLSTQTILASQAPLCISRFFKNSKHATFVGELPASLCSHTFQLAPSANHQSTDLSTSYAFAPLMAMPGSKWRNPLRFSGPPSLNSGKPHHACPVDDIHCHTYPTTPWRYCPSVPSSTCYNLTLFEPDNASHPITLSVDTTYFKIKLQGHKDPYPLFQYQPLMGAALSGQYSVWEYEPTVKENGGITPNIFSRLVSLTYSFCFNSSGVFFLCGNSTYVCLPANWSGVCTLVFQYPDIELLPDNQTISVPLFATVPSSVPASRRKRALHLLPLLAGLGIASALGLGIAGITTSTMYFQQLSKALSDSLDEIATSIISLQDQIDSLAGVVLQNRRALDLIVAERGGTCLFLQEECCFYINQSGVVRHAARKLRERASELGPSSSSWIQWLGLGSWLPLLTSFMGPILFILVLLVFGPCLLNCLTHSVSRRMSSFIHNTTKGHVDKILLLRESQYKRLPQEPPEEDVA